MATTYCCSEAHYWSYLIQLIVVSEILGISATTYCCHEAHHSILLTRMTHSRTRVGENFLWFMIERIYYIGPASLKTLPPDLESPLQGKEYGPFAEKVKCRKVSVLSIGTAYSSAAWGFLHFLLREIECVKKSKVRPGSVYSSTGQGSYIFYWY